MQGAAVGKTASAKLQGSRGNGLMFPGQTFSHLSPFPETLRRYLGSQALMVGHVHDPDLRSCKPVVGWRCLDVESRALGWVPGLPQRKDGLLDVEIGVRDVEEGIFYIDVRLRDVEGWCWPRGGRRTLCGRGHLGRGVIQPGRGGVHPGRDGMAIRTSREE